MPQSLDVGRPGALDLQSPTSRELVKRKYVWRNVQDPIVDGRCELREETGIDPRGSVDVDKDYEETKFKALIGNADGRAAAYGNAMQRERESELEVRFAAIYKARPRSFYIRE